VYWYGENEKEKKKQKEYEGEKKNKEKENLAGPQAWTRSGTRARTPQGVLCLHAEGGWASMNKSSYKHM
jgi:hypothetical protein